MVAQLVKNLCAVWETWVRSLGQKIPWRRAWLPTPIILPGEALNRGAWLAYNPWGRKESGMTEWLNTHSTRARTYHLVVTIETWCQQGDLDDFLMETKAPDGGKESRYCVQVFETELGKWVPAVGTGPPWGMGEQRDPHSSRRFPALGLGAPLSHR